MISGLVLKYLNEECFVICGCYKYSLLASTSFCLTEPPQDFSTGLFGSVSAGLFVAKSSKSNPKWNPKSRPHHSLFAKQARA
jgi:hypothetical protein